MPITEVEKIWMDGELVDWARGPGPRALATRCTTAAGSSRGSGRTRPRAGPRSGTWTSTSSASYRSAKLYHMDIPFSHEALVDATKDVIRANGLQSCYIRPLAFRGYGEMGVNPLKLRST